MRGFIVPETEEDGLTDGDGDEPFEDDDEAEA